MNSRLFLAAVTWMAAGWRSSPPRRGLLRTSFLCTVAAAAASDDPHRAARPMRLLHVQIVHRHGDRTPITPLLDEAFWQSQVVPDETLRKIGSGTRVVRDETAQPNNHGARGRGPFGQLTKLGLLQMVEVGTAIRDRYTGSSETDDESDSDSDSYQRKLWTPARPLHPNHIKVYSTDFARTIQSVQGLLVGLLPERNSESDSSDEREDAAVVEIDARHTHVMIPYPQPRNTDEQVRLERELVRAAAPKEKAMLPLARRVTAHVRPLLAPTAHEISFGVNGDGDDDDGDGDDATSSAPPRDEEAQEPPEEIEVQPLSWNQLAEVCKCLSVYDRLPSGLPWDDVAQVLNFSAQRWFDNLQNARLVHLATSDFVRRQLDVFCQHPSQNEEEDDEEHLMSIWSAHDSSIVGLLCAYRLERHSEWPDYASHLVLELWQDERTGERFVQFSMNGAPLQCRWEDDAEPHYRIPLDRLVENVARYTGLDAAAASAAVHSTARR
jgi:Histidine phosphatase superfamily (branch 2)